MEHDELCPARCDFGDYANGKPNTMCRGGDCTRCDEVDCLCDGPVSLIARVRADEREACARRVEEATRLSAYQTVTPPKRKPGDPFVITVYLPRDQVLAAIREAE